MLARFCSRSKALEAFSARARLGSKIISCDIARARLGSKIFSLGSLQLEKFTLVPNTSLKLILLSKLAIAVTMKGHCFCTYFDYCYCFGQTRLFSITLFQEHVTSDILFRNTILICKRIWHNSNCYIM